MNKASISDFWYKKHNKVLAILFISIALILMAIHYLTAEILSGWTYFQENPDEVWNLFVYAVCYLIILIGNIKNDSIAYTGILMFVCYTGLDAGSQIIDNGKDVIDYLKLVEFSPIMIPFFLECLSLVGLVFLGIFLYVRSYQYLKGTYNNFMAVRALAISFAACLALSGGLLISLLSFSVSIVLAFVLIMPLSSFFVGLSIIFTVERLRRN